jgi:hypothetical protein
VTKWTLSRYAYTPKGTFGRLTVPGLPTIYTVEQIWKNNKPSESCIPIGEYVLSKYFSPARSKDVILLSNEYLLALGDANHTPRAYIEIHPGNWARDLRGCIAPGTTLNDTWGVSNSKVAMSKLMEQLEYDTRLVIENTTEGGIPV